MSKEELTKIVQEAYRAANPDLPFIPEPLESLLEELMLTQILPKIVDEVYKRVSHD